MIREMRFICISSKSFWVAMCHFLNGFYIITGSNFFLFLLYSCRCRRLWQWSNNIFIIFFFLLTNRREHQILHASSNKLHHSYQISRAYFGHPTKANERQRIFEKKNLNINPLLTYYILYRYRNANSESEYFSLPNKYINSLLRFRYTHSFLMLGA